MKQFTVPLLCFVAAQVVSLWNYSALPDQMAIHFGPSNEADGWADKWVGAFLLPVMILLVPWLQQLTSRWEQDDNKRRRMVAVNANVSGFVSAILFALHVFVIRFNLGHSWSPSLFAALAVGVLLIAIGNLLPRMPQGKKSFPRIPEAVYPKVSRFNGRVMVGAGIVLLFSSLLPAEAAPYMFGAVMLAIVVSTVGSTLYYKR